MESGSFFGSGAQPWSFRAFLACRTKGCKDGGEFLRWYAAPTGLVRRPQDGGAIILVTLNMRRRLSGFFVLRNRFASLHAFNVADERFLLGSAEFCKAPEHIELSQEIDGFIGQGSFIAHDV